MLEFVLSAIFNQPINEVSEFNFEPRVGFHAELVHNTNAYLWASNVPGAGVRILGQGISHMDNYGVGIGYKAHVTNNLNIFIEYGVDNVGLSTDDDVKQEVVYTYLVGRHNVYGRPVPVINPHDQTSFTTSWDIDDAATFRVGAEYEIDNNWSVSAAYKFFSPKATMTLKDPIIAGGGYWTETNRLNMDAFVFRLNYKF